MQSRWLLVVPFASSVLLGSPDTAGTVFSSDPARVALIELYTSEGCSSCPPAEAKLASLQDDARLWREFVPLALHVAYWDRLGWRDRFAQERFAARHSALAAAWPSPTIYTPCWVRDGREWAQRNFSRRDAEMPGVLSARVQDDDTVAVTFSSTAAAMPEALEAHVALLGCGLTSRVRSGENAGRVLQHAFVVLDMHDAPLVRTDDDTYTGSVIGAFARRDDEASRYALAVWVTRRGQLAPIQATGGWLPDPGLPTGPAP